MTKKEVVVGGLYRAKINNNLTTVRLVKESRYGGWDAVNLATNREVRIKSAAKLRCAVTEAQANILAKPAHSEPKGYVPSPQQVTEAAKVLTSGTCVHALLRSRRDGVIYGVHYFVGRDNEVINVSGIIAGVTGAEQNEAYKFVRVTDQLAAEALVNKTSLALFRSSVLVFKVM